MNYSISLNTPLKSIFWPKESIFLKEIGLIIAGVMVLGIAAHIAIPLRPVPLTFQSSTVLLIGMAYGARLGGYTLVAYLLAGILGLPVFANVPTDSTLFFGPTSGYLIGFLPGAIVSGYCMQKGLANSFWGSFI